MGFLEIELDEGKILALPESQRAQAEAALMSFRRVRREVPLWGYNPLAHQHELHIAQQRLRALMGGNRAGKTTCGVVDDLIEVTPLELLPPHLHEYKRAKWECPRYVRCMAPSNKLLNRILVQKFREYVPRPLLRNGQWGRSFSKQDGSLYLECGCRIDFMSYEMDLDKFGGDALHRCHYDEEPPEDIRDECYARLIDFAGVEVFTMTPLQGMTWMYDDVWLKAEYEQNQGRRIFAISASMLENTHLDPEAVEDAQQEWEGDEQYEARIEGKFVHFGGMVYPTFDEAKGEAPSPEWVQGCDVVCGIDPGVAGGGVVWIAFDGRNDAVIFAERFLENLDVAQVCDLIDDVNETWGLQTRTSAGADVQYVIDPSARSRSITHNVTIESEFNVHGIYPTPGENDREAGCFMVRRRIRAGQLSVSEDLSRIFWEAKRYRVQPREDGKWDVVKENDHVMDAMRYAIMLRPYMSEPAVKKATLPDDVAHPPPKKRRGRREEALAALE